MRTILLAGVVLALSACGGGETANDANVLVDDNLMMDSNLMVDPNMSVDAMNGMGANGAMGGAGAVDSNTQNMMEKDAATNDPDTNLANGL